MNRNTKILTAGAVLVALLVAIPMIIGAIRGISGGYYRGPGMMGVYGWGGWWMPVVMVLFWGLVVWGIIVLIRYFARTGCCAGGDTALEILRKRYASGEINREEFEEKKRALM